MTVRNLVSVIVPAYNASSFIEETLRSVLTQTHNSLELICINDGSTDSTLSLLRKMEAQDDRITVIDKVNSGVCDTRNLGIIKANGEFIIFLDADDVWESRMLETCVAVFNSQTNVNAIYTKGQLINENTEKLDRYIEAEQINGVEDILEWKKNHVATPSCTIMRTAVIEQSGIWDTNLSTAADQDFFLRIAQHFPIHAINEVLFYYRVHGNNMHQNIALMEKDHLYVFKKADKNGLFKSKSFRRQCFAGLYLILAGSWWKDGKNKFRGLKMLVKAVFVYPPIVFKLMKKLVG
ncbi:MAG: glycosyltransferase [Flavobacteriales bacterium]|nr:glycosyltransferase [Flavobacteriales bacterium]